MFLPGIFILLKYFTKLALLGRTLPFLPKQCPEKNTSISLSFHVVLLFGLKPFIGGSGR